MNPMICRHFVGDGYIFAPLGRNQEIATLNSNMILLNGAVKR